MEATPETFGLKERILVLVEEWDEQVKEFRRLSLAAEDPSERSRMRAKADTKHYSRQELLLILEEAEEDEKLEASKATWPGLSGVINSIK